MWKFGSGVKERVQRMLNGSGDANIAAFGGAFIFIVVLIIAVIAFFLDIVYVAMIWSGLPSGFLQVVAAGGAILVSPVVILILLAKLYYFRSGGQLIFSYFAFAVDLAFAVLNTYCAFQIAWHDENSFVLGWRDISPITPVVILALLAVLLVLDPHAKRRNLEREQQEKGRDLELRFQREETARQMAIKELNAEFAAAQQEAAIEVRMEALEEYKRMLKEELLNEETRAVLREGARRVGENAIHDLTGLPRKSALPSGPVVPSLPPAQPAEKQPAPEPPTPASAPIAIPDEPKSSLLTDIIGAFQAWSAGQSKQVTSAPQPSYADDLAASVPLPQPEQEYVLRKRPQPTTDQLAPFPKAPSQNGASQNGHNHLSPMVE